MSVTQQFKISPFGLYYLRLRLKITFIATRRTYSRVIKLYTPPQDSPGLVRWMPSGVMCYTYVNTSPQASHTWAQYTMGPRGT